MYTSIPSKYTSFSQFPAYRRLVVEEKVAQQANVLNPFFLCHEGHAKDVTRINGEAYLNFSTYDYLGLNDDERIKKSAIEALNRWGTSAGASRLVAGERPIHHLFEQTLAEHYQSEDCIVFVSGHATNVSTISQLFGPEDIIFHDALAHNSIVLGSVYSRAKRISYPHNDCQALERLLKLHRSSGKRCLIVTEGVFSMDGNIVDLPSLIELKKKYKAFLMVDEAHALGVIGDNGGGTWEYFKIDPKEVDLWMGTCSKTLCGCGGYIAGCKEAVKLLKFTSPGFVYSVGMSPVLAAASFEALKILHQEPYRVKSLQALGHEFVRYAKAKGLDTGRAGDTAIVPIMLGNSLLAGGLATRLHKRKVNVMPIIYPVVEEGAARLRFFLSASHTIDEIHSAIDLVVEELPFAKADVEAITEEGGSL